MLGAIVLLSMLSIAAIVYLVASWPKRDKVKLAEQRNVRFTQNGWR